MVASHLSIHDATQLRLVSRFFADVAGAHILPEVTFHMHQDDFARLRGIASNGVLAPNVRSITYFAREYKSPVHSFGKFKKHHKTTLKLQAEPISLRSACEAKPADDLTLRSEYEKYKRMVAVQNQIKVDMADLACLKDVVAKFTGLRHATMSAGNMFYEGLALDKPSPFMTPVQPPTDWPQPEGVRHLEVMLEALAYNNIKVASLRAGTFDWTFFDKSSTELERLFQPVLDAGHVELEMRLRLDENLHDVDGNTKLCRRFMKRGILRDLLARMKRLDLLRVGFLCDIYAPYEPVVLRDIMSPGHHWPHLTQLELSNIEADRHTLMQVLGLHKDNLQFLCLQDIDLGETSWEKLLPEIRNTLYLQDACICGTLIGRVEDEPDGGELETWELDMVGIWENDMRASINRYCRNGGKDYPDELPLTDEVVQKHFDQYVKCHVSKTQDEDFEDSIQADAEMHRKMREAGLIRQLEGEDGESGWDAYDSGDLDDDEEDDDDDEGDEDDDDELVGVWQYWQELESDDSVD